MSSCGEAWLPPALEKNPNSVEADYTQRLISRAHQTAQGELGDIHTREQKGLLEQSEVVRQRGSPRYLSM